MPTDDTIRNQVEQWRAESREQGVLCEENLPFFLAGSGEQRSAVLLVHGFTASPWEMRAPAEQLAGRGHDCLAVRLPGHGTTPEDLRRRTWPEWFAVVQQGIDLLAAHSPQLDAVGSSTGAMLILRAATGSPLRRLALLSPFLKLQHWLAPYAHILKYFMPYQSQPKAPEVAPYFYARRPLSGVAQINFLRTEVEARLATIRQPTLVLCSAGDQTVASGSAKKLYALLGSETKEFYCYGEEAPHVLTIAENPHLQDTLERLGRFLN
jgi:carboxylesterase